MIRNALLIITLTLTTPSLAYRVSHDLESCYFHSPTVVVGKVIAVQDAEPREIRHESTRSCVFPHAEARRTGRSGPRSSSSRVSSPWNSLTTGPSRWTESLSCADSPTARRSASTLPHGTSSRNDQPRDASS